MRSESQLRKSAILTVLKSRKGVGKCMINLIRSSKSGENRPARLLNFLKAGQVPLIKKAFHFTRKTKNEISSLPNRNSSGLNSNWS
jgi:hypothetical protein